MRAFLKELSGLIAQYAVEVILWLAVLIVTIVVWRALWPIEEMPIAVGITVACVGAVASAQPTIVALIKAARKPKSKKK